MRSSSAERGTKGAPPDGSGLRLIELTESETLDRHLVREKYMNADGRLLVLYRHRATNDV